MNNVSDAFLLEVAGIAASLLGFFVIGVFFYVQRGMFPQAAEEAQRYMQAGTRSVILLYGMTLLLALALVVLADPWVSLLYLAFSLLLLWSVARMSIAIRHLHRALGVRVMSQLGMWAATAVVLALPWALGGVQPDREHVTWAVLLIGALAFSSSASLVLFAFDISGLEASAQPEEKGVGQDLRMVEEGSALGPDIDVGAEPDSLEDPDVTAVGRGRR